jgi:two-component system, chemotaxis family, sensor kinase CheA
MPDGVDRSIPGEPGAGTLYREARELAFELSLGGPAAPDRAQALWRRAEEAEVAHLAGPLRALAEALETGRSVEARLAQLEAVLGPAPEVAANPFASDPQLLADFFIEAREHLVNIEARLLELEQTPENAEAINSLFRSFHTLKGLAGFLEFNAIQEVAHEVETLLDLARNGQFRLDTGAIDSVLAARDYVERWLKQLENGAPTPPAATALLEEIRALARGESAAPAVAEAPEAKAPERVRSAAAETAQVRVNTAKLEYMVDMVGELVIAQAMLRHDEDLAALKAPRVQRNLSQLARVTAEVQKTAMAMRMVPIGQLFRRMTRLVRDLSHKSGKRAELEMFGEEVELDRTIVEELADPLVHMLRNSMDHGLEGPEERTAAGKAPIGWVALKARHQSGQILIEVSDDGRGLRRDRILAKALERGLVKSGEGLTDSEVYNLIFEPGFSTAERVTEVSGRGVGMDVVRKHVEKLRGRVDVDSEPGRGTRFTLRVPLTLAIIDGLVLKAGGERFILPISSVREMFRPTRERLFTVEGRREMALVREKLLPVVRLYQRFGLRPKSEDPCEGLMVVGEADGRPFCLLVDEMLGKQEVVIKSLGPVFRQVEGLAGGAVLGDGRVGLILEMSALAREQGHGGARV